MSISVVRYWVPPDIGCDSILAVRPLEYGPNSSRFRPNVVDSNWHRSAQDLAMGVRGHRLDLVVGPIEILLCCLYRR